MDQNEHSFVILRKRKKKIDFVSELGRPGDKTLINHMTTVILLKVTHNRIFGKKKTNFDFLQKKFWITKNNK